jgi:hypothetical protein
MNAAIAEAMACVSGLASRLPGAKWSSRKKKTQAANPTILRFRVIGCMTPSVYIIHPGQVST